jgi:hypothetical protein
MASRLVIKRTSYRSWRERQGFNLRHLTLKNKYNQKAQAKQSKSKLTNGY